MERQFKVDYLRHLSLVDDLADSTIRQYRQRITIIEKLAGKPIEQITADDAMSIKAMKDTYSSSYRKSLLVTLRSVHDYGALIGKWERNGISYVKPPREENFTSLPLAVEQVEELLQAARTPAEIRVTHLPSLAGLRIGEAAMIRPPHWLPGRLYFRREKTRRLEQVPVHPRLQLARRRILSISPAWPSMLQDAKEALEQRTGITFIVHQLRKTFAQAMLDRGADWITVQKMLGHTLGVSGRYMEPTIQMEQEALRLLPF